MLACAGCRSAERQETQTIARAIELLQGAEPASRQRLLEALEEQRAEGEVAERARTTCVAAYRALTQATQAAAALPDGGLPNAADADARALLETLRDADEQLKRAQQLLPQCRDANAELRNLTR